MLLLLLIVLAAPFYNGGMLVGTFLLTGVIFLSSQSFSQMLWRLAAGVYVLACCAALGFPGFFAGAQAYSARFSGFDRPLLQFHWPVEFSPDLIAGARQGLCAWGVVCDRMAQWPLALTGSYWLQVSIIVGAIAVAIRMRPPLARVGALFAVLWIVLLAVWTGANLGIMAAFSLSPIYFFLMMYPFWAFFSLYAGVRLIRDNDVALCPEGAICRSPLGLRRPLRGGCRAHPAFPGRGLSRVRNGAAFSRRRDADYASSAGEHRAASRPDLSRIGRHSPRFAGKSVAASTAGRSRAAAQALRVRTISSKAGSRHRQHARPARLVVARYPDPVGVWPGPLLPAPLVLFERELDIRLRWEFSFWRNRGCRLRDAEDVRALELP